MWKEHCFLCATAVTLDKCCHEAKNNHAVRTLEMRKNILDTGHRRNDPWSLQVIGRVEACNDLVAEEAVYHKQCYSNFVTGGRNAKDDSDDDHNGQRAFEERVENFDILCTWLESPCDLHSMSELHDIRLI